MQAKKPSFLSNDHALLTAMVQLGDPESCVTLIRNSAASGAEAFGIQLCYIEQKYKTEETYRYIFSRCGNKPPGYCCPGRRIPPHREPLQYRSCPAQSKTLVSFSISYFRLVVSPC